MKVLGSTLCPYMCWAKRKHFVQKYCDPAWSQCLRLYMQIRVVLVLRSNAGGVRGALWGVQRGVPGVTSPGVKGRKLPRTGWQSITVEGCGLLCVLLRLHSVWQRETTKKHRRHLQARHSTSEERRSLLARNKKWCEQKARRSVSEARQKTASAEHSSTVFPPKNITRSWRTQSRGQAQRS